MQIHRIDFIDHIVLVVNDLDRMVEFYCDVLGCSIERLRGGKVELAQLRAGQSVIGLTTAPDTSEVPGAAPRSAVERNLHHFCIRVQSFDEETLREHLSNHGIRCGELQINHGAEGIEPALHFEDPEGNRIELTGKASGTVEYLPELSSERCGACHSDAPHVTQREIEEFSRIIPEWKIIEREGIDRLERNFRFPNFVEALAFTNCVAEAAEREGHHPEILTGWGEVTVTWWSHKIKGLHRSDFIMAAKTDAIFR